MPIPGHACFEIRLGSLIDAAVVSKVPVSSLDLAYICVEPGIRFREIFNHSSLVADHPQIYSSETV